MLYRHHSCTRPLAAGLCLLLGLLFTITAAAAQEAAAPAAAVPPPATAPAAARQLTLAQSIALAAENHRGIQAQRTRVERALAIVDQAGAPVRLSAAGSARAVATERLWSAAGGYTALHALTRTVGLSVGRQVDISHTVRASVSAAELGVTAAQLELERVLQQVGLLTRLSYYTVLRAEAARGVTEADVKAREEHLKQAEALEEAGVTPHSDVLTAQAQLANARQSLIAARSAVEQRRAELNNLLCLDVQTPLQLQQERWPVAPLPQESLSLEKALASRVELRQAEVNVALAERGITVAQSGLKPSLGLSGGLTYTPDTTVPSPRATNWNITATYTVPLKDGGLTDGYVRQRRSELAATKLSAEQARQDIALEVVQAISALRSSAERVEAARANIAQATEALRLATLRYGEGIATFVEITDAQALLTQSQANAVDALYDCLQGQARYERAVGEPMLAVPQG